MNMEAIRAYEAILNKLYLLLSKLVLSVQSMPLQPICFLYSDIASFHLDLYYLRNFLKYYKRTGCDSGWNCRDLDGKVKKLLQLR